MITARIDKTDSMKLERTLAEMSLGMREGIGKYIQQAGRFAVTSARKATPIAKKRPQINLRRMGRARRAQYKAPWWATHAVVSHTGGHEKTLFAGNPATLKAMRVPPGKGLAKAAWTASLHKLGSRSGTIPPGVSRVSKQVAKVRETKENGNLIGLTVTNDLDYVSKIAPMAAEIGIQKAGNRMEKLYLKKLDRSATRIWQTGRRIALGAI